MQSVYMAQHFKVVDEQRGAMNHDIKPYTNMEWERPFSDKWSLGETYYHLYLMVKRLRQLNRIYAPVAKQVAATRKHLPYKTHSRDVYTAYKEKNQKPMKAPFILMPPRRAEK